MGAAERQQGWKAAFACTHMWGDSWFDLYSFKTIILNTSSWQRTM
jgi:hypothetical protein